jgi:hypothetical protein
MKVSFLLGAGFSYDAGLPMVSGVSEKFLQQPLADHTLNFFSGEWKWRDWATEPEKHNGILPSFQEPVSMIIEALTKHFLAEKDTEILNYEQFYQYILDMARHDRVRFASIVDEAQQAFDAKHEYREFNFDSIPNSEIYSCFYHLVDDLLWIRKPYEEIEHLYAPYINYFCNDSHTFNIFTLNHDLLLEKIFFKSGLSYSDGFSTQLGRLVDDNKDPLRIFDGSFSERISLLKLHGSIDTYKYQYIEKSNSHLGFDYFKTMDYHAKQGANHINEKGEILQNWTPEISPKFITGQNKQQMIAEDKMYSDLYHRLQQIMPASDRLIVVGYSFMDDHINEAIKAALPSIKEVIHINPSLQFKFEHRRVREIDPFKQAIQF